MWKTQYIDITVGSIYFFFNSVSVDSALLLTVCHHCKEQPRTIQLALTITMLHCLRYLYFCEAFMYFASLYFCLIFIFDWIIVVIMWYEQKQQNNRRWGTHQSSWGWISLQLSFGMVTKGSFVNNGSVEDLKVFHSKHTAICRLNNDALIIDGTIKDCTK